MTRFIAEHRIVPVIDSTVSTSRVQDALRQLEGDGTFGKIVLLPA